MTSQNKQRVYIEFQRVQTWLFAVPRLRTMVGANALLGEVLRIPVQSDRGFRSKVTVDSGPK